MQIQVNKQSGATKNTGSKQRKKKENTFRFQDNRQEAQIQRKIQEIADNSSHAEQTAQLKRISGNSPVIQLASSIDYNTTEFDLENETKEIVGQKVIAHIESDDQIRGSAPGPGIQAGLMQGLKDNGYRRMIRGHLLNGQFGGLGVAFNLYPITAKANSLHKNYVENHVKGYLTNGKNIDYTVEVQNAQHKVSAPNAEFKCVAKDADTQQTLVDQVISSVPSKTPQSKNSPAAEGAQNNNTISKSFPTRNLKRGFGESGKGFSSGSTVHKNTVGKISSIKLDGREQIIRNEEDGNNKLGDLNQLGGRSFIDGAVDRIGYAYELIASYEEVFEDSQLYIDGKGYTSTQLEELVDACTTEEALNKLITRLESVT